MEEVVQITKNHSHEIKNGHNSFAKGNQIGRMKKRGFTLTDLNKVVVEYEKTHDQILLKHYISQLFKDNNLLSKYIDKNVPTKSINELTGKDGSPLSITLNEIIYENPEKKDVQD